MEWKVGDRVVGSGSASGYQLDGRTGTIVNISLGGEEKWELPYGIRWDVPDEPFHSCDGKCEHGRGWWVSAENISPVISEPAGETVSETSNPIFHFKAGENLGEDAWKVMVGGITGMPTWEDMKEVFSGWEGEYKESVPGTPMPGAYRSAKSVIKGAINNSIPLMAAGEPRGKTAVQKDIKAAKERDKEVKTPAEVIAGKLEKAWKVAVEFNKQEYFHEYVKAHFIEEN